MEIREVERLCMRAVQLSQSKLSRTWHTALHVFRNPADVSRNGTDGPTPQEGNTAIGSTRLTSPVQIGGITTIYPSRTGRQDIISPRGSIGPQEVRDAQPLEISINGIYSKHRDPAPTCSKVGNLSQIQPMALTRPMDFPQQNGKAHVLSEWEPDHHRQTHHRTI